MTPRRRRWTIAAAALPAGALLALGAGCAAAPAPPPAAAPTLAQIVDRYIAWRGGPAFRQLRAEHDRGLVEGLGLKGRFDLWQSPDGYRTELDLGGASSVSAALPHGSWVIDASGRLQSDPDAYKFARRDPQSAAAVLGQGGAHVRLLGAESLDGRTWQVVRVQYGDADTYDDLIDPATGELGAVRAVERGQRRIDRLSDWRMVDGVRTAFVDDTRSETGTDLRLKVTEAQINPRVDPAIFRPPQTTPQTVFANGAATSGWIAFAGADPNRIFLPVTVNDHPVVAMLDSGAAASVIDAGLAASLRLSSAGQIPTQGENGRGDDSSLARGVSLGIGAVTFRNLTIHALDLAKSLKGSAERWPFIIGDEIFEDTVVDLDFANRRVAFWSPAAWRPPPHAIEVRLQRDGALRLVPVTIGSGPPALFVMDTGFWPNLRLSPALTAQRSLLKDRLQTTIGILAIGGAAEATLASLDAVTLGGVTLRSAPAIFSDTWPSSSYSTREQGLLGLGILRRFRVIVDWPQDRLFLIPDRAAIGAPFARDLVGLQSTVAGAARRITAVLPNSPAANAGLKPGDILISIDGKPAWAVDDPDAAPEGARLTLVTRRDAKSPPVTTTLTAHAFY